MENLISLLYPGHKYDVNPFGYIPESQIPGSAVYNRIFEIGGSLESYDWRPYAPARERQYWIPFCVSFSRLNCAETIAKRDGLDINLSDRELGVVSGTTLYGNSLEAVSEVFRKKGVRTEEQVPFTEHMVNFSGADIWDEIFNIPEDRGEYRYKGGSHSWVYGLRAMVDALKYSPLQMAVGIGDTWEDEGVVRPPKNLITYHAVTLLYIDSSGYLYIQDSIGKEFKKLSPDYGITGCKSFRDLPQNWKEKNMAKFYRVDDHGKLGIAILEGFTGVVLFEDNMNDYLTLQKITSDMLAKAPIIKIPDSN